MGGLPRQLVPAGQRVAVHDEVAGPLAAGWSGQGLSCRLDRPRGGILGPGPVARGHELANTVTPAVREQRPGLRGKNHVPALQHPLRRVFGCVQIGRVLLPLIADKQGGGQVGDVNRVLRLLARYQVSVLPVQGNGFAQGSQVTGYLSFRAQRGGEDAARRVPPRRVDWRDREGSPGDRDALLEVGQRRSLVPALPQASGERSEDHRLIVRFWPDRRDGRPTGCDRLVEGGRIPGEVVPHAEHAD